MDKNDKALKAVIIITAIIAAVCLLFLVGELIRLNISDKRYSALESTAVTELADAGSGTVATAPPTLNLSGGSYTLALSDDFNGETLNGDIWSPCPEQERSDMGAYWDDSMILLDGQGHLLLCAGKDEESGRYISGAIRSKDKFEQTYGYFEVRCRLQTAGGFWGAFWLMNDKVVNVDGSGRDGTEIDIFESPYLDSGIDHALHYDGYGEEHQKTSFTVSRPELYEGYHTYGLEWTENGYVFYVDGEETWRTDFGGVCENPLYLKLSTEIGSWAGAIDDSTLPDALTVDYVRVYTLDK